MHLGMNFEFNHIYIYIFRVKWILRFWGRIMVNRGSELINKKEYRECT